MMDDEGSELQDNTDPTRRAPAMSGPLAGIRILDLTDSRGEIAGRILADLGAEVLKIEPPEGVNSRRRPPFSSDGESLFWATYGAGKQTCHLDLESGTGQGILLDLARGADVVIESFAPGRAAALAIDDTVLAPLNPRLVYISICAYGRTGPKAPWPATDLTLEAAGGRLSIQGDQDRPPLPVGYPQAWLHAGAQAAADVVIALNERAVSGRGQYLDLSAQEAMWWTLMAAQGTPVCVGNNPPLVGDDRGSAPPPPGPQTLEAKDGLVTVAPGASPPGTKTMYTFAIEEAREQGTSSAALDAVDWDNWAPLIQAGKIDRALVERANEHLKAYVGRRTKLELVEWALANNLRLGPLHTTRDLLEFPQFVERGVFKGEGESIQLATWAHLSRTPLTPPAPARETAPPDWPRAAPVDFDTERTGLAFEGLRVADFSWVAAGPTIGKALADHGATVIKVESGTRPDLSRTLPPHINGEPGLNRSYWSFLYGTSKLSLQCNLATEAGKGLARTVCDWADVVIESFSPGTMERMGLGYETLATGRDDLIMLSTSMLGQTGPLRRFAGYGQQASGFCGFHYITGWPDRVPCGVATPYTDVIAPKFGIAALASAILERRNSGKGQHIDLAQAECAMMFLAPLILDEAANGVTAERMGFDSRYACPQGVYPTRGTERYIAIAAETTAQWQKLAALIPDFAFHTPAHDAFDERWSARESINAAIGEWTVQHDAFELERELTREGVPAAAVQRPLDVASDAQLNARGIRQILHHSECGDVLHWGFCTRFSAREEMIRSAPPCLGEHNSFVLRDLLGLPEADIERLAAAGALV